MGIDTGLRNTGLAVLGGQRQYLWAGTIEVEGDSERTGPRYGVLRRALQEAFGGDGRLPRAADHTPDLVAIEQPELEIWKGREAASVMKLYAAFAVTFAECERLWPRAYVVGVTPAQWKGTTSKAITESFMRSRYPGAKATTSHEWDALGLADWGWDTALAIAHARRKGLTGPGVPKV